MSVYIKGMEMPANCSECPMCYDMMRCTVAEPIIDFCSKSEQDFDFCRDRHPRCPLVLVPDHGRLIDADAALANRTKEVNWCYDLCDLQEYFENCPTIIPAD